jgi:chloramphenicol O-acetyltransferase type A
MENFENRRDRFEFFNSMENPLINVTFNLSVPDFREFCKREGYPPFHFFLYTVFASLMKVDNFRYRIYQGEVIKTDKLVPTYTVLNQNNVLNFTRFEYCDDLKTFIERSLASKEISSSTYELMYAASSFSERELKNYVFITSLPWLDFTSIQHPVYKYKSADIPSIAWGMFRSEANQELSMSFSIQAHHGFVDGYHFHLLAEEIKNQIKILINK